MGVSSSHSSGVEVAVVGGGIIGLACARALARRGVSVAVLDRAHLGGTGGAAGGGASHASAGMLAPLAEAPEAGPFADLCRAGRDLWTRWAPELEDESGLTLDYDRAGALILDEDDLHARLLSSARAVGEPAEEIEPRSARRLVPDLAPDAHLLHLPGEHRVDNRRVCAALAAVLERRDVRCLPGHAVHRIEASADGVAVSGIEIGGTAFRLAAERVVVAAGAWSGTLRGLPTLPVVPIRGQMLRLDDIDWPFTGCLRGSLFYAVRRCSGGQPRAGGPPRAGDTARGGLLIGATVEPDAGFDARCTPDGLAQLLAWCRRWLPGSGARPLTATWAGLRPAVADHRPVVGTYAALAPRGGEGESDDPDALERVWLATAHHRNGVLLAPWTAEAIAAALLDGERLPDIVSPRRLVDDASSDG